MPPILERCIAHVMAQGKTKDEAYPICRASLDLAADGSQDGEGPEMTDDVMASKVRVHLSAIPKREDVSPKEGENAYGDVAFADPTNKKYPIDTEEHVRAAWNYINKAANAGQYSGGVAEIKARIIAAWKRLIDKDGPPSAANNANATIGDGVVLRKEVCIGHAGRGYRNGSRSFDLTEEHIDQIVKNYDRQKPQIPIFLRSHPADSDEKAAREADGWIEGLRRVGRDLMAKIKLHGDAARLVAEDKFRGMSPGLIFAARDTKGQNVGAALDHLAVLNDAFFSDLNVAARRLAAATPGILHLVSRKEATMAKDNAAVLLEDGPTGTDEISDPKALDLIKAKENDIIRLKAESMNQAEQIETLKAQLASTRQDPKLSEALVEIERMKRRDHARDIIALVEDGLYVRHNLKPAWTKGYKPEKAGQDTLECAIQWLKASRFQGDIKLLRYQVETGDPIAEVGKQYPSGRPQSDEAPALSAEEKELLKRHGLTPEQFISMRKVRNIDDFRSAGLVADKKEA